MRRLTCSARVAACTLLLTFLSVSGPARADERPLIWAPSKIADNAYAVKMGIRLPAEVASIGADLGIHASETGKIPRHGTPVKLWVRLASSSSSGTAHASSREVNLSVDAVKGASNLAVASVRNWIVTPDFELESRRALSLDCNSYERHCHKFHASQAARLVASETETALVAQGSFATGGAAVESRIGIEQRLWGTVDLGLSVANPGRDAVGSVTARYALNW